MNSTIALLKSLLHFLPSCQKMALLESLNEAENNELADKIMTLATRIEAMPITDDQDSLGDNVIAYLHYFSDDCDWFITGKDRVDVGTVRVFGLTRLRGHHPEIGYIRLNELLSRDVTLDLEFKPIALQAVRDSLAA